MKMQKQVLVGYCIAVSVVTVNVSRIVIANHQSLQLGQCDWYA